MRMQPGPEENGNKFYLQVAYSPEAPEGAELVQQARTRLRTLLGDALSGIPVELESGQTQSSAGEEAQSLTVSQDAAAKVKGDENTVVVALVVDMGEASFDELRATRLILRSDGSKDACVDVPLPALFGAYWKLDEYTGAFTAIKGKRLVLRFPIPVGNGLEVALGQFGKGQPAQNLTLTFVKRRLAESPPYRFCAEYRETISKSQEPIHLADIKGEGVLVGCTFAGDGLEHLKFSFLEGNEQITVDGAVKPTWEGTGTEDFFNSAWYFSPGTACRGFHGLPHLQAGPPPQMSSYRFLIPDRIAFKQSLKWDFQHGSRNGCPDILYKTVALWYQRPPCKVLEPAKAAIPVDTSLTDTSLVDEAPTGTDTVTPGLLAIIVVLGAAAAWKYRLRKQR